MAKYTYDEQSAEKAIAFIETFVTHVKGELAGKPFELEKWQKDEIIKPLFGYKDKDGLRQYRQIYCEIPRKNGKSSLCAALCLYVLFCDDERGAEIYSAAADRQQAGIVFEIAKQMVLQNPELSKRAKVFRNSITYPAKGNTYKAISADAYTKHGFNAHCIIMDELHSQPNRELYDVLVTSTASRTQPIIFSITTAGYDKNTICYEQNQYAIKVRDKIIKDDTFLPILYRCENPDKWDTEAEWERANPNYKVSVRKDYLKQQCLKAKNSPSFENTFKRLHLNLWTSQETKFISDDAWMQCNNKPIIPDELKGRPCYGGLDLSSTRDMSAFVLLFPDENNKIDILPFFWIPKDTAIERNQKENIKYLSWIQSGQVIETEGNVIDYNYIKQTIKECAEKFDIKKIAYDRWNATQLVIDLVNDGANLVPYGMGYKSMSAPTKELEKMVLDKSLNHGGNEVLRWQMSNVAVLQDPTGALKPAKNKSKEKIDGIVALIMGLGIYMHEQTQDINSIYEDKGISFF